VAKNIELMEHVLGVVEASTIEARDDGRFWIQGTWGADLTGLLAREVFVDYGIPVGPTCKTAACFAGWTLLESGYTFQLNGYYAPDRSGRVGAPEEAARLLGLDEGEAGELFYAENTLDDIRTLIKEWAEESDAAAL